MMQAQKENIKIFYNKGEIVDLEIIENDGWLGVFRENLLAEELIIPETDDFVRIGDVAGMRIFLEFNVINIREPNIYHHFSEIPRTYEEKSICKLSDISQLFNLNMKIIARFRKR